MQTKADEATRFEAEVANEPQWVVWPDASEEAEWAAGELDHLARSPALPRA
jgi:hypothetical protein